MGGYGMRDPTRTDAAWIPHSPSQSQPLLFYISPFLHNNSTKAAR